MGCHVFSNHAKWEKCAEIGCFHRDAFIPCIYAVRLCEAGRGFITEISKWLFADDSHFEVSGNRWTFCGYQRHRMTAAVMGPCLGPEFVGRRCWLTLIGPRKLKSILHQVFSHTGFYMELEHQPFTFHDRLGKSRDAKVSVACWKSWKSSLLSRVQLS